MIGQGIKPAVPSVLPGTTYQDVKGENNMTFAELQKRKAHERQQELLARSRSNTSEAKERLQSIMPLKNLMQERLPNLGPATSGPLYTMAGGVMPSSVPFAVAAATSGRQAAQNIDANAMDLKMRLSQAAAQSGSVSTPQRNPLLSQSTQSTPHPTEHRIHQTLKDFEQLHAKTLAKEQEVREGLDKLSGMFDKDAQQDQPSLATMMGKNNNSNNTTNGTNAKERPTRRFGATASHPGLGIPMSQSDIDANMKNLHPEKFRQLQDLIGNLGSLKIPEALNQGNSFLAKASETQRELGQLHKRMRDEERRGVPKMSTSDPLLNFLGSNTVHAEKTQSKAYELQKKGVTILSVDSAHTYNKPFRMEWVDMCWLNESIVALLGLATDPETASQIGMVGMLNLENNNSYVPMMNPKNALPSLASMAPEQQKVIDFLMSINLVPVLPAITLQNDAKIFHYIPKQIATTSDRKHLLLLGNVSQPNVAVHATLCKLDVFTGQMTQIGFTMEQKPLKVEAVRMAVASLSTPQKDDTIHIILNTVDPETKIVGSVLAAVTSSGATRFSVDLGQVLATDVEIDDKQNLIKVCGIMPCYPVDGSVSNRHGFLAAYTAKDGMPIRASPPTFGLTSPSGDPILDSLWTWPSNATSPTPVIHASDVKHGGVMSVQTTNASQNVEPTPKQQSPGSPFLVIKSVPSTPLGVSQGASQPSGSTTPFMAVSPPPAPQLLPSAEAQPSFNPSMPGVLPQPQLDNLQQQFQAKRSQLTTMTSLLLQRDGEEYDRMSKLKFASISTDSSSSAMWAICSTMYPLRFASTTNTKTFLMTDGNQYNTDCNKKSAMVDADCIPLGIRGTIAYGCNADTSEIWIVDTSVSKSGKNKLKFCIGIGEKQLQCVTSVLIMPNGKDVVTCGWWQPHPWLGARAGVVARINSFL